MAKKAVLIGINQYRIPGADLRGCVKDVEEVRDVLRDFYGFSAGDILILQDANATKTAMQQAYENLLEGAQPGDVLLTHFSGHGSNVPDKSGDEADYRDEILCPTDLDWKDPLLDDWLRQLFDSVPEGVNLTVVMDCCHSGSNTRAIGPPDDQRARSKERFLPCPLDLLAEESGRELRGALRGGRSSQRVTADDVKDIDMPELLITGCRNDQTSADAFLDGAFHGALTYALVRTIREAKGQLTYRALHARTTAILTDRFTQVPQLEGRAAAFDRMFLTPLG